MRGKIHRDNKSIVDENTNEKFEVIGINIKKENGRLAFYGKDDDYFKCMMFPGIEHSYTTETKAGKLVAVLYGGN